MMIVRNTTLLPMGILIVIPAQEVTLIVKKKDYFLKYYDSYIFHSLRECDIEESNIVYYRGVYLCVTYMPENDEFIVTNSAKNLVVLFANCFDTYYAYTLSLSKLKSAKFYKLCVY